METPENYPEFVRLKGAKEWLLVVHPTEGTFPHYLTNLMRYACINRQYEDYNKGEIRTEYELNMRIALIKTQKIDYKLKAAIDQKIYYVNRIGGHFPESPDIQIEERKRSFLFPDSVE